MISIQLMHCLIAMPITVLAEQLHAPVSPPFIAEKVTTALDTAVKQPPAIVPAVVLQLQRDGFPDHGEIISMLHQLGREYSRYPTRTRLMEPWPKDTNVDMFSRLAGSCWPGQLISCAV